MSSLVCKAACRPGVHSFSKLKCQTPRRTPVQRRRAPSVVRVSDVNQSTFETEVLQSQTPVLVDFWATWCGPCKLVAPSMVWAEKEYKNVLKVVKIEADPNPALVEQYKVYGLPTFMIFKDGQLVEGSHWEGALTKKQLVEYLHKHGVVPAKVDA